jgi:uncharacterized protein YbjT (DUF2867 family)
MAHSGGRTALLAGATGLIGGHCLELLAADPFYSRVIILVRRPVERSLPPKIQQLVINFDHLHGLPSEFQADDIYCALGTTIRQAGSADAFRKVDLTYPLSLARMTLERGAQHFLVVSSLGANASARVLYSRVKGEMERDVLALPFRSITIFRPSLLLGHRKEFRLGEEVAKRFAFLTPARYKPIDARRVARAMVAVARAGQAGPRIIESAEIQTLGAPT